MNVFDSQQVLKKYLPFENNKFKYPTASNVPYERDTAYTYFEVL